MSALSQFLFNNLMLSMLFTTSLIWWSAFPLVSITTGEIKPRQLYVDENSLMINAVSQSSNIGIVGSDKVRYENRDSNHILSGPHCSWERRSGENIIICDSKYKSISKEIVIFVLYYIESNSQFANSIAIQICDIVVNSTWLSKRVMIISKPAPPKKSHQPQPIISFTNFDDIGLIRESYILDMTIESRFGNKSARWDAVNLHISGLNGVLPNMDIVASVLALFPFVHVSQNMLITSVLQRLGSILPQDYRRRLCSLLSFCSDLLRAPQGLHAQFLKHNVDSITLQLSNRDKSEYLHESVGKYEILELSSKLLRMSSNLQGESTSSCISSCNLSNLQCALMIEELHHSQFFYLLMGDRDFVVSVRTRSVSHAVDFCFHHDFAKTK